MLLWVVHWKIQKRLIRHSFSCISHYFFGIPWCKAILGMLHRNFSVQSILRFLSCESILAFHWGRIFLGSFEELLDVSQWFSKNCWIEYPIVESLLWYLKPQRDSRTLLKWHSWSLVFRFLGMITYNLSQVICVSSHIFMERDVMTMFFVFLNKSCKVQGWLFYWLMGAILKREKWAFFFSWQVTKTGRAKAVNTARKENQNSSKLEMSQELI